MLSNILSALWNYSSFYHSNRSHLKNFDTILCCLFHFQGKWRNFPFSSARIDSEFGCAWFFPSPSLDGRKRTWMLSHDWDKEILEVSHESLVDVPVFSPWVSVPSMSQCHCWYCNVSYLKICPWQCYLVPENQLIEKFWWGICQYCVRRSSLMLVNPQPHCPCVWLSSKNSKNAGRKCITPATALISVLPLYTELPWF